MSNRILCKLQWVAPHTRNRENPWNSELRLTPATRLLKLRRELVSLMDNPAAFIARIFGSEDKVWVERCLGIIS